MNKGETRIRVRYKDTDQMGVAYYANYFVWFEVGRTEFFRGLGMPYREFEKNGIYLPVIRAYCDYKLPAVYDDEITVITRVSSFQEVRLSFNYGIYRGEDLLAEGGTEHVFVNHKGRPVVLRKKSPFLWRRLQEAVGMNKESI